MTTPMTNPSTTWSRGRQILLVLAAFLSTSGPGGPLVAQQPGSPLSHGYSRPARSPHSSRSEVIAPTGMVAASQPLAAQVGLDILKAGGNAIDAAVAVNAMLGLVEPNMNGVGGDLFAIVWDAESEKLYGLNATGRAPYALNRQVFERQGLERVPANGPLPWTVPGAVDGWDQLLKRFGTMSFADVLAPATAYARNGFPVTEVIQRPTRCPAVPPKQIGGDAGFVQKHEVGDIPGRRRRVPRDPRGRDVRPIVFGRADRFF